VSGTEEGVRHESHINFRTTTLDRDYGLRIGAKARRRNAKTLGHRLHRIGEQKDAESTPNLPERDAECSREQRCAGDGGWRYALAAASGKSI
jgi:hypothetical protein